MIKLIFIISLIISNYSFADVSLLEKGQQAPYKGYLFSPDLELEVRVKVNKNLFLESLVIKQQQEIDILNNRVQVKDELIINVEKQLKQSERNSSFEKIVYFMLGIVITSSIYKYVK